MGDFPASFVEEIEIPKTKEEKKRLAQRFAKKSHDKLQKSDGKCLLQIFNTLRRYMFFV